MKKILLLFFLIINIVTASAQRGFNYYKDSSRVGSLNAKAYVYFKKAYYDHIWKWTTEGADSAEYYLKLAIKEDPDYSAAYAFLAHVYQFKTYTNKDRDKFFALEKQNAEKALSFNPKTGDGYSVMSDIKWEEKDTTTALNLLRKAIAMEPDNVGNYLWIAIRFGQMEQPAYYDSAIIALRRIMELDPEYGQAYMKLGNVYHWRKPVSDSAKYYYYKAIHVYNVIKPKDNRMMDGYYWLGELYKTEKKYDSAVYYFTKFLIEMESSEMYVKEMRLSTTYKALYECHQQLSGTHLKQFIELNRKRIANNQHDAKLLLTILEDENGGFMSLEQDSVSKKYALPLARRIQTLPSNDPYIKVFAVCDEYELLKKLKRYKEAMEVLKKAGVKHPNEPLILFELGRANISNNKPKEGFAYLQKSKQYLNDIITKDFFTRWLMETDFDKVRNTGEFKKLSKWE